MFSILTVIFTGLEFMTLEYLQNNAAHILNVKAVAKIMHAPMSFMDTTPLGRILNRFTKDTDSLDNEIGEQMRLFIFPLALLIELLFYAFATCLGLPLLFRSWHLHLYFWLTSIKAHLEKSKD